MKFLSRIKRYGIRIAAGIFCCCVALLFAVNVSHKVRAEESTPEAGVVTESTHACLYFTSNGSYATNVGAVNNQTWSYLIGELSGIDDSTLIGEHMSVVLHLTEDISWDDIVYVPTNVHIGICLNGNTLDCDFEYSNSGRCGVYVFDCTQMHKCDDGVSYPVLTQELVDFLPYWWNAGGGVPALVNLRMALGEDVSFARDWTGALQGGSLDVCLNGYNLYNAERLTVYGGTLEMTDCQPDKACNYFVAGGDGAKTYELGSLTSSEFEDLAAYFETLGDSLTESYAVHCTLRSNVTLSDTLIIPKNVFLGICLNGYNLNAKVSCPKDGSAGYYTFDCEDSHECEGLHTSVPYLSQGLVDFMPVWLMHGGTIDGALADSTAFALASDVTFGSMWQGFGEGVNLTICMCGFTLDKEEILAANVETFDCSSESVCRVCHPLAGAENIPLYEVDLTRPDVYVQETLKQGSGSITITKKAIDCFTPYVDENGVFIGDGSSKTTYFFTLKSDMKLANTLTIPAGMDVHICLNGYQIESPKIIFYKEKADVVAVFNVEYGASLSIYDCSPNMEGGVYTNIGDSVTETSEGFDLSGIGVVFAYSICNAGSFTMNGGNVAAMIGVINTGDLTVNGGALGGAFLGVVQGKSITIEGMESLDVTPSVSLNGGSITSAMGGVLVESGELEVNDGSIRTLGTAISIGRDMNGDVIANSDANLTINGGTIEYSESVLDVFIDSGLLDVLDVDLNEVKENMDVKDVVAILVNGNVEINGDFEVVYSEAFLEAQEKNAAKATEELQQEADSKLAEGEESVPVEPVEYMRVDISLAKGSQIDVGEDADLRGQYTILAENGAVVADNALPGVFVGAGTFETAINEDNELIIFDAAKITIPAKVVGTTASTSGLIMLNFYVQLDESFVENDASKIIIRHKGVDTEYTMDNAKKNGSYYVFSVGVNAKDYKESVTCDFSSPIKVSENLTQVFTWHGYTSSVDTYLSGLLESTNPAYDSVKKIAATMKDYCMSASVQFGVSTEYEYSEGIEEDLSQIKIEDLAVFERKKSGTVSRAKIEGTTLFLESATTIRVYFSVSSGVDISDLTCTINGEIVEAGYHSGSLYYIEMKNIAANKLGTTYEFNVDGDILSYSAMSYVYGTITKKDSSSATLTTAKMLYLYYKAAVEYDNR